MEHFDVRLTDAQKQIILLSLAHMAVERPGGAPALADVADALDGRTTFETFMELERDSIRKRDETLARIHATMPGPGRDG
jgi:hypothetical protein